MKAVLTVNFFPWLDAVNRNDKEEIEQPVDDSDTELVANEEIVFISQ